MCRFYGELGFCPLDVQSVRKAGVWCGNLAQQNECGNNAAQRVNKYFMHRKAHSGSSQHGHEAALVFGAGSLSTVGNPERIVEKREGLKKRKSE